MDTKNLEKLLTEYEQKRRMAQINLEEKEKELYKKYPRLEEINNEINRKAINKAKAILKKETSAKNYDIEIEKLKEEKIEFIKKQ